MFYFLLHMVAMEWYSLFLIPVPPLPQWRIPELKNILGGDHGVDFFLFHPTGRNNYSYNSRDNTLEEPYPTPQPRVHPPNLP